jgi:hypothetical protein
LAATSLLALLTALAVPKRADAEERANHATSVRMVRDAERDVVSVVVGFSDIPAFTARLDRNGLRLVVDVPNADLKGAPSALTDRLGVVGGVMVQAFPTDGKSTTRLLVTLLEQAGAKPYDDFKIDAAQLAKFPGTYKGTAGNELTLVAAGPRLTIGQPAAPPAQRLTLVATGDKTFKGVGAPVTLTIQVEGDKVTAFILTQGPNPPVIFTRVEGK